MDSGRTVRGYPTRDERDDQEGRRGRAQRHQIRRAHAIEQPAQQLRGGERARRPDHDAGPREAQAMRNGLAVWGEEEPDLQQHLSTLLKS